MALQKCIQHFFQIYKNLYRVLSKFTKMYIAFCQNRLPDRLWLTTFIICNVWKMMGKSSGGIEEWCVDHTLTYRSSHQRCSVMKRVLRNFIKFTGKHLRKSLYFNKVRSEACNFIKTETLVREFSCEFYQISKNTF